MTGSLSIDLKDPEFISMIVKALVPELTDGLRQVLGNGLNSTNQLLSEKEMCEYLRISGPTIIKWRQKGKIPFIKVGSTIRYNKPEVIKALAGKV